MPGLKVAIGHLYPDLNMSGDRGNVLALSQRCIWHGFAPTVTAISLEEPVELASYDLLCLAASQDRQLDLMVNDLRQVQATALGEALAAGVILLAVGGAFQSLGRTYIGHDHAVREGLGLLDCDTVPSQKRFVGNAAITVTLPGIAQPQTIVGFENHFGRTYIGPAARPLGRTTMGYGNNGQDGTEGLMQGSTFGTYLHGPILPRNPWFADYLLAQAVQRRYPGATLRQLDDSLEELARNTLLENMSSTKWPS